MSFGIAIRTNNAVSNELQPSRKYFVMDRLVRVLISFVSAGQTESDIGDILFLVSARR